MSGSIKAPSTPEIRPAAKAEKHLAFNIKEVPGGLFAAQIIKYEGERIAKIRTGTGTTFGHAVNEAADLLTHFHLYEFENGPDSFFEKARMI